MRHSHLVLCAGPTLDFGKHMVGQHLPYLVEVAKSAQEKHPDLSGIRALLSPGGVAGVSHVVDDLMAIYRSL